MGPAVYLEAEQGDQGDIGPPGPVGPIGPIGSQGPVGPALYNLEDWSTEDHVWAPWMDTSSNPYWNGVHAFFGPALRGSFTVLTGQSYATLGRNSAAGTAPTMTLVNTTSATADQHVVEMVANAGLILRHLRDDGVSARNILASTYNATLHDVADISFGNVISGNTYTFLGVGVATFGGPIVVGTVAGDAATPVDGEIWYNSQTKTLRGRQAGVTYNLIQPQIPAIALMMDDYSTEDVIIPVAPPVTPFGAGVAIVDFGAFPGASDTSLAVTGIPAIKSTSGIVVALTAAASADHSADEHWAETLKAVAGNVVAGTGFTIYVKDIGVGDTRIYGKWNVAYHWVA